jgi:hypothetical protein
LLHPAYYLLCLCDLTAGEELSRLLEGIELGSGDKRWLWSLLLLLLLLLRCL